MRCILRSNKPKRVSYMHPHGHRCIQKAFTNANTGELKTKIVPIWKQDPSSCVYAYSKCQQSPSRSVYHAFCFSDGFIRLTAQISLSMVQIFVHGVIGMRLCINGPHCDNRFLSTTTVLEYSVIRITCKQYAQTQNTTVLTAKLP
jgi:hypothetical protein